MNPRKGPVRVMLVEDHNLVRAVVADTLARHGIEVTVQAASAEEALALLGAMDGDLPMPRKIAARVIRELTAGEGRRRSSRRDDAAGLSAREEEVLDLVSAGLTDREIGERLAISPRTVGHHVGSILDKLGAPNRARGRARLGRSPRGGWGR